MSAPIISPFQDLVSPKDTTPQAPTETGVIGKDRILGPPMTGDFKTVFAPNIPAQTATFDSPFDMSLAKSTGTVTGPAPSGNSTEVSPFIDALCKGKMGT